MMIRRDGEKWRWIGRLYNMAFERGGVPVDWRFAVIVSMYKVKGERTQCRNYYRGISSSVVEKLYA